MSSNEKLLNFKIFADEFLSEFPCLNYEWEEHENSWMLTIFKDDDGGFDVSIDISQDEIVVSTEPGLHENFDSPNDIGLQIQLAFGLVRDLLSQNMRIREHLSNNKPYRWDAQSFQSGKWITEGTIGLLFWNYLGRKSKRFYVNDILEPRKNMHFE